MPYGSERFLAGNNGRGRPGNSAGHPSRGRLRVPVERVIEQCRVYLDGVQRKGQYSYSSALREVEQHEGRGFVWLSLNEPSEEHMLKIAEVFDIDELIVEDAVTAHQRPKLERYERQLFMVIRSVQYSDRNKVADRREIIDTAEVQLLMGQNFIITIRHDTELPDPQPKIEEDPDIRGEGPAAIAWATADHLVDEYVRIAALLEMEVDRLEEEVFTPGSKFDIEQIYTLKREILEMRHAVDPLIPALRALIQDNKDLVRKEARSYFRDVLDHAIIAADQVDSYDERLSALINAGVAMVSLRQNRDMRTISAVVGMAAVPTLIAGIYGMNFDYMPELHYRYAYFITLAFIVLAVLVMWWWFRRNDWL
ncbi:Magnesium transport protein CorA [Corynebacterium occultum]|uniref:Magnesium transport protein CorA n=1 Tax=Corynebacterium occultum TaxID=2675219 RepID=A0A6B8W1E2_9CORY|nr:magnesium/cobalt transporter CorA [Corynebacterium occultum]QGU07344.1 Magnesium transport protein CorA [Corynebacterium occultum]